MLSDRIVIKITTKPGETFIDRMINLVEGAARQKTPNEIALNILLASLTIVFLLAVVTLQPFAIYAGAEQSMIVLTALLVCLIPTTIGALLSAIGIAGMDRLVQRNVLAMSGRAVEAAGDVSTLLLDKTGTITLGNRQAAEFVPVKGVDRGRARRRRPALLARRRDPRGPLHRRPRQGEVRAARAPPGRAGARRVGRRSPPRPGCPASTCRGRRAQGPQGRGRLGHRLGQGARRPGRRRRRQRPPTRSPQAGGTPLLVAVEDDEGARVLGVIHLKDVVKEGMRERFDELRRMGIKTVMITGDNPLTAKAIAEEAGVDDFLAEATPEDKMALIKREQAGGKLVAMTGDGTNDAPALAQADVGVAMNTGTSAAKEAGNMVDLDSNPTKLIEIVEIGKQLLITRGALTTFSIANDVAKYFAIIPAMFAVVYPGLDKLNIMGLASPESAILSAVIFNALIIIALVPLALQGRALPADQRGQDAPPQPRDLRPRRPDRPVHRHQAHRPAHLPHPWHRLTTMNNSVRQHRTADRGRAARPARPDRGLRRHLPARRHRRRPGRSSTTRPTAPRSRRTARSSAPRSSARPTTCRRRTQRREEAAAPDLKWFQPRPSNGLGTNSVNTQYKLILSGATNRSGDNARSCIKWVKDAKAPSSRTTPPPPTRSSPRTCRPTRSPPPAPAWTRTSPRSTPSSRSTGSPRRTTCRRPRSTSWSRTTPTAAPSASSASPRQRPRAQHRARTRARRDSADPRSATDAGRTVDAAYSSCS